MSENICMIKKKNTDRGMLPLGLLCFFLVMLFGRTLWEMRSLDTAMNNISFGSLSRLLNGVLGGVITFMALTITLASNLYTPGLVKVFIGHPVTIAGLSVLVASNLLIIMADLISPQTFFYVHYIHFCYIFTCFVLASIIPYLYFVTQFLRPSYFLGLLEGAVFKDLNKIEEDHEDKKSSAKIFNSIDTISNVALTAAHRDDRQLMILVMDILHNCLLKIIRLQNTPAIKWRTHDPEYMTGLFLEGQEFLYEKKCWPEAYVMGKISRLIRGLSLAQDEVIFEVCDNLQLSFRSSISKNNIEVMNLHFMFFNNLFLEVIEEGSEKRYQYLSYNYRQLLVALATRPEILHEVTEKWLSFVRRASEKIVFAYEAYIFEIGLLLIEVTKRSKNEGLYLYRNYVSPTWSDLYDEEGKNYKVVVLKAAIKAYWTFKSLGEEKIAVMIKERYLQDKFWVKKYLKEILMFNSPLHWHLDNRMMGYSTLPVEAEKLARKSLETDLELAK